MERPDPLTESPDEALERIALEDPCAEGRDAPSGDSSLWRTVFLLAVVILVLGTVFGLK